MRLPTMTSSSPQNLEGVDKDIYDYLDLDNPNSFLLFAGAGSGKTRTLVNVLKEIRKHHVHKLIQSGHKVAIITYTNAASDEIKQRLEYDPVFCVSTIHSFAWDLIKPFTEDIRVWLRQKLASDVTELQGKIDRARDKQGKTALKNTRSRDNKQRRLNQLSGVSGFLYSPSSSNTEKGSLHHAEVISIAAHLIANEPLMRKILVNRFPILLIDESQDTNKDLLEAFIATQQENSKKFSLGLFGDMMQRIYGGGKPNLDSTLPKDWKKPAKTTNYRSPKRIIKLINQVRSVDDAQRQYPKPDASEGIVRLFIINSNRDVDKFSTENDIRNTMAVDANDELWRNSDSVKSLTLEHHMAALRGGFADFLIPLLSVDKLKDAALNGQSSEIKFLKNQLLPLMEAIGFADDFAIANIIRNHSYLLSVEHLKGHEDPIGEIRLADSLVEELNGLQSTNPKLTLLDILKFISEKSLLSIPDTFKTYFVEIKNMDAESVEDSMHESAESKAWDGALSASFDQVVSYAQYTSENSNFGTHQGVKGLEFKRVMVILDDQEAKGFLFKYEKLLGAEPLSKKDKENETEGIDSSPKRTRRLFYVTCSRAEESLAVVAYTKNPDAVKKYALDAGWFQEDEIVCCG